jgi:LacI family transcriptional regulator
VSVDDVLGGDVAATHLLDGGHERLAFVGGPAGLRQVADRRAGAARALTRSGRVADLMVIETVALNVVSGQAAGRLIAAMPAASRPTAVFCANDLLALGLLQELTRHHLGVPEDVAIVGYDDIEFAAAAAVPLTSVRQPRQELGRMAAQLLMDETSGSGRHKHRQVVFQPELEIRRSSQAAPASRLLAETRDAAG